MSELLVEKERLQKRLQEIEVQLKRGNINNFIHGWKPFSELSYKDHINKSILVWCEYPAGGEARTCYLKCVDLAPYININVIIKYLGITQNPVAWKEVDNFSPTYKPYKDEDHRKLWREIVDITNVRTIKYE